MNRTVAREIAIQVSYSLSLNDMTVEDALESFFEKEHYASLAAEDELYTEFPDRKQLKFIQALVEGTAAHRSEFDSYIEKYSKGWKLGRISRIAVTILRNALFEVIYMDEVPDSVAINEAVELSKGYEVPETVSFINGILGSFMRGERGVEIQTDPEAGFTLVEAEEAPAPSEET
ncbi:MAG: transcription antitermination factor NusB [Oscillospiraceae bacterium]